MATEDFIDALAAAYAAARKNRKPISRARCVPRPRQEITEALLRWRSIISYYEPTAAEVKVSTLYEYAAQRLLRESITTPTAIAHDFYDYRHQYASWWEQWRNQTD